MTLENWAQNAWLKRQATSAKEIQQLLKIVDRDLRDCEAKAISADAQFTIAFNAALQVAVVVLRAAGYRTVGQGHHFRAIDSLRFTLKVDADTIDLLQVLGRRRNACNYDVAGSVTDDELKQVKRLAVELREKARKWLRTTHPELLK